jgi:hypothetical protein
MPINDGGFVATSLSAQIKRIKANQGRIISPRIDKWLIDHPEGIVVPDDIEWNMRMHRLLSGPNADRSARFGASGRLSCERRQVFTFLNMPGLRAHDPVQQNLFNDGTFRHIRWQIMGMLAGVFTEVEVAYRLPQYNLKVSLDAENKREGFGVEIKGMSFMKKLLEEGLSDYHNGQVHTCMLATGYDRFIYIAEDKRSQSWVERVVVQQRSWMTKVKDELNALTDAIEDQRLPAALAACKAHKGEDYRVCPYSRSCLEQHDWPTDGSWD